MRVEKLWFKTGLYWQFL